MASVCLTFPTYKDTAARLCTRRAAAERVECAGNEGKPVTQFERSVQKRGVTSQLAQLYMADVATVNVCVLHLYRQGDGAAFVVERL